MQKSLVAATLAAVLGMGGSAYAADIYAGGGMKTLRSMRLLPAGPASTPVSASAAVLSITTLR